MQKGEYFFDGPKLLSYSDECESLRKKADRLHTALRKARFSAAGANELQYSRMMQTAEALKAYFSGMSKASLTTYEDASDAARRIMRMAEENTDRMRSLHLLAPE